MIVRQNSHAKREIMLESSELDFKGRLTTLFRRCLIKPLVKNGKRRETCSIKRTRPAKQDVYFDKLGY